MRLLLVPPRRGIPVAAVMAIALVAACAGRWTQWLGVWSETQNHLGAAFIFGLPAAAGLGAWLGAGNRRSGLVGLQTTSSRHRLAVVIREYAESAVWTIGGCLIAALSTFVATALVEDAGRPRLLPLLAQMACVAGATATGQLVGSRLPLFLGAPLSAAVVYLLLGFGSFTADPLLIALTPLDERSMTFHAIAWWVLVLQLTLWAALFVHAVFRHAGLPLAATATLFAAATAATPLVAVTPSTRTVSAASVRMSCTDRHGVALCLPAAKSLLAADLRVELARSERLLAGLLPARVAFIDNEAAGTSPLADRCIADAARRQRAQGRTILYASQTADLSGYTRLNRNDFHYYFISFAVPAQAVGGAGTPGAATPADVIWRWYLTEAHVPIDSTGGPGAPALDDDQLDYSTHRREVAAFGRMDATDRARWFAAHASAIATGQLQWSDL